MTMIPAFLLQDDAGGALGALIGGSFFLMILVVAAVCIAGMWKVFVKAGQPGWAVLVPFYNLYLMLKIVGRPAWWILLFLIPFVSLVIVVIFAMDMAKSFGKSAGWGIVMLLLLGGIGYLVLGFGDARYVGPAAADGAAVPATA